MLSINDLLPFLPYDPTPQQEAVAEALLRYLEADMEGEPSVFILNGYAGTGKTSMVGALVKFLASKRIKTVLMSPTGRAAKVFGRMAGATAWTIHRRIYHSDMSRGESSLAVNALDGAVFIVDEASMIGDDAGETRESLLEDLLTYVHGQGGIHNKLILLGDTAQLPPVGTSDSPALTTARLKDYGMRVTRATMTQTVRQASQSGILYNATRLRKTLYNLDKELKELPDDASRKMKEVVLEASLPSFRVRGFDDVTAVDSYDLIDDIATAYARDGADQTLLVTRANWSATAANMAIRSGVLACEEELIQGERLMVVQNNYLWHRLQSAPDNPQPSTLNSRLDFIANGDMAVVDKVHGTHDRYGLRFADVTLTFPDSDVTLDCKVMLDTLTANTPALDPQLRRQLTGRRLAEIVSEAEGVQVEWVDPAQAPRKYLQQLRNDPWVNALQIKYAYAVTCHKAQGGQWRNVFVDLSGSDGGSTKDDAPDSVEARRELLRWLYTAVTRATHRLYLVNAPEKIIR